MTHGEFKQTLQVLLGRGVTSFTFDSGTADYILKAAYQDVYQFHFAQYPGFLVSSFGYSGSTIDLTALVPPFRKANSITSDTGFFGQVRIADLSQYQVMQNIPSQQSNSSQPLARVDKTQVVLGNSGTGTFYYYRKIDDTLIDDSTNITTLGAGDALLHPAFEDLILWYALMRAYARHLANGDLEESMVEEMSDMMIEQQAVITEQLKPLAQWSNLKQKV